jgi:hypothetical protein
MVTTFDATSTAMLGIALLANYVVGRDTGFNCIESGILDSGEQWSLTAREYWQHVIWHCRKPAVP